MKQASAPERPKRKLIHFTENCLTPGKAKTTRGVLLYSDHETLGVIDSIHAGKTLDQVIGAGAGIPVRASLEEFLRNGTDADVLLVGTTSVGGQLTHPMRKAALEAIEAGLDVWSGMHGFMCNDAEISEAARQAQVTLWDVRRAPQLPPVASARCRNARSYICLTVGTDCAVGKMSVSLEMQNEAVARGQEAEFVATGQTGIIIAGWGHPVDAVPGDFMAGCVEQDCLSVDGRCEVIHVEGQGSLYHPGYSAVTLGIMHGACPDGIVLCAVPGHNHIWKMEHAVIPSLPEVARYYLDTQAPVKPTRLLGVALNTYEMGEEEARAACAKAAEECGVPATDPVRFDAAPLVDALEAHRNEIGK